MMKAYNTLDMYVCINLFLSYASFSSLTAKTAKLRELQYKNNLKLNLILSNLDCSIKKTI